MGNIPCNEYISQLIMENESLKKQVHELSQNVMNQKNWSAIREGVLLPKLIKTYGHIGPCGSHIITPVFGIIKEMLDVKKTSEINASNFDVAKEIAAKIMDIICEYEWKEIARLQQCWDKYK